MRISFHFFLFWPFVALMAENLFMALSSRSAMTGVIKIIEENIPEVRFMHFSFM
jgi:hypothetical protein